VFPLIGGFFNKNHVPIFQPSTRTYFSRGDHFKSDQRGNGSRLHCEGEVSSRGRSEPPSGRGAPSKGGGTLKGGGGFPGGCGSGPFGGP